MGRVMTELNPKATETPPPGWPSPKRMAVIMEAIRRGIERYREEFDARDEKQKGQQL